jgi:hypothetical protein
MSGARRRERSHDPRPVRRCGLLGSLMLAACGHASPPPPPAGPATEPRSAASEPLEAASGAVFVGCGYLWIENHGATHFTVLLRAEHGRQIQKNSTKFLLDDVVVEATSTTAREIGAPDLRGAALLRKHMEWEAEYLSHAPAWRGMRPEPTPVGVDMPYPTLPWMARPTGDAKVLGQKIAAVVYVTAAINDVVFVLAAPARTLGDLDAADLAIDRSLKTLHETSEPTDLAALSIKLKESKAPWPGCEVGH